MSAKHVELRPDRDLLHTNFDGYRLSLDPVPVLRDEHKSHQLPNRDYPNLETQYSFLHQELFGHQNLLVADPWTPNSVFYVTNGGAIENVRYEGQITRSRRQFQLPGKNALRPAGVYNYSLQFISEEFLVASDGAGNLFLISTGDRKTRNESAWRVVHEEKVLGNGEGCVIRDGQVTVVEDRKVVNVLLLQIIQDPDCSEKFMTKLLWIRLRENGDANWERDARKELHAKKTVVPFCALTKGGHGFVVATQKTFKFVLDTEKEVKSVEGEKGKKVDYKAFTWTQSEEDVVVNFGALEESNKSDFYVKCTATTIVVKFKEVTLINAELGARIDPDLTTWQLQNDTLQVTMVKAQEGELWAHLIPDGPPEIKDGDSRPEVAESFTSVPNLTASLEECDRDDGEYYIEQVDAKTHSVSHRVYLGANAPLFGKQLAMGRVVALRHDVDTCVWALKGDSEHWRHLGTLDAFGYVAASKQQRKFLDCSPDMNYSVICEPERHVFIYMAENATASGLRNRNGNQIRVGQQRLVALEGTGEVLGISVQDELVFLLTQKFVLCLKVKE